MKPILLSALAAVVIGLIAPNHWPRWFKVLLGGLAGLLIGVLCNGCASFHTTQTEYNPTNGLPTKTTRVDIRSFFDSHNDVTKLRTTFTDKSQGIGVGAISENTSGSNAVQIIITGANIGAKALTIP